MVNEYQSNTTCLSHTNCYSCVGIFSEEGNCYWCPSDNSCGELLDPSFCVGSNHATSCSNSIYSIIFISIIVGLSLLCCCVCLWKSRREGGPNRALLPEQIRGIIFRNSLADSNEHEWMCVICGYDNRPRANDCPMCGTSKKFTIDYKTEKKDKYKKKLEKAAKKKAADNKFNFFFNPIVMADDSNFEDSRMSHMSKRASMSAIERLEALNYRRLNSLSLRQKGARRRRMWRREIDEDTGEIKWVRQAANETGKLFFVY